MKVFFLIFFLFLSCSTKNEKLIRPQNTKEKVNLETSIEKPDSLYEIVKIDYQIESIQRIFIVIPTEKVNDQEHIMHIICDIKLTHELSTKSHISFFTEKKYADYKENVFEGMNSLNGMSSEEEVDYKKWLNTYYLSEFDCGTREYLTYPGSGNSRKMKKYLIKECS